MSQKPGKGGNPARLRRRALVMPQWVACIQSSVLGELGWVLVRRMSRGESIRMYRARYDIAADVEREASASIHPL